MRARAARTPRRSSTAASSWGRTRRGRPGSPRARQRRRSRGSPGRRPARRWRRGRRRCPRCVPGRAGPRPGATRHRAPVLVRQGRVRGHRCHAQFLGVRQTLRAPRELVLLAGEGCGRLDLGDRCAQLLGFAGPFVAVTGECRQLAVEGAPGVPRGAIRRPGRGHRLAAEAVERIALRRRRTQTQLVGLPVNDHEIVGEIGEDSRGSGCGRPPWRDRVPRSTRCERGTTPPPPRRRARRRRPPRARARRRVRPPARATRPRPPPARLPSARRPSPPAARGAVRDRSRPSSCRRRSRR